METYAVINFLFKEKNKKEKAFKCLFRVKRIGDSDELFIKEVLIDNSEGLIIFKKVKDTNFLSWKRTYFADNYTQITIGYFEPNSDILFEANSNEEAILWFKLSYGV